MRSANRRLGTSSAAKAGRIARGKRGDEMSSAGGGLAQLLLMLAAARRQAILGRRSAAEELANKRAERDQRERELQLRVDQGKRQQQQADQDAAMQRAKPFIDAVYGPNSADTLASLQQNGMLGGFIPRAEEALKAAGMPSDLSHLYTAGGIKKVTTPGHTDTVPTPFLPRHKVNVPATSSFQPISPQGPKPDLTVPAQEHIALPQEWRNPAAQPFLGSYAPPAFLQALGLGEQPVTPAGPINVPLPSVAKPPKPILPTWKTQIGQENAGTKAETAQSLGEKRKTDAELVRERILDLQAMRQPKIAKLWEEADKAQAAGDLARAQTLRTQAQTETEAFRQKLLTAQTGLAGAQTAAVPAKVAETGRHNV